jgi:hypothetical protein
MSADKIIQFVCFETGLDSDQFISKWQEFSRSGNLDKNVILQQAEKENGFSYIAQHLSVAGELKFVFEKSRRSSRIRQPEITAKLAGGYSILQRERKEQSDDDESKVFVFLLQPSADLDVYRQLSDHSGLNIYEAYYENCRYAYILEFFVQNEYTEALMGSLKQHNTAAEIGIYKECVLQL